jgi:hypothetical protein
LDADGRPYRAANAPLVSDNTRLTGDYTNPILRCAQSVLATFLGLLFPFSAKDATAVAIINDGFLQHVRVVGGAGLGAKYLSRVDSRWSASFRMKRS